MLTSRKMPTGALFTQLCQQCFIASHELQAMRQAVRTDSMHSSASALATSQPATLQQSCTPRHCFLQQCERALTQVKPGQRVNCVPGIQSLTRKGRLIATLTEHYGEGAFELTPRSWLLPEQYWHWRLWAESQVRFCSYTLQTKQPCLMAPPAIRPCTSGA